MSVLGDHEGSNRSQGRSSSAVSKGTRKILEAMKDK